MDSPLHELKSAPQPTPDEAQCSFLELEAELSDVSSIGQYIVVVQQLVGIKNALGTSPIATRVRTAIRDLQERLPQIRELDDQKSKSQLNARIAELERDSPRCVDGHSMVVRQGPEGSFFWGCSFFPSCRKTKRLTREQSLKVHY